MKKWLVSVLAGFMVTAPIPAKDPVNLDILNQIRDEGFNRSEVLKTVQHLSDHIGPRLSGSPGLKKANTWTRDKLSKWGLENAHLEGFDFGRGWTYEYSNVVMTSPRMQQIRAIPVSWHPGTAGIVEGSVIRVSIKTDADFEKYKGLLKGKILAVSDKIKMPDISEKKFFERHDEASFAKYAKYKIPGTRQKHYAEPAAKNYMKQDAFKKKYWQFLKDEGAIATIKGSRATGGQMDASGYSYRVGETPTLAQLSVASESYNRILRLIEDGKDVALKIEVRATFYDDDRQVYNTIAEIPGVGRHPEIVMAGAHLDSWFVGDGAVDNASGVAIAMEATRILKAIDIKPKRTIRIALWAAEEQGLVGSRAYVREHFLDYPLLENTSRPMRNVNEAPIIKPEHKLLSAYFNVDTGSGKIRGIFAEGNVAAMPIFNDWFKPFSDLGATFVSPNDDWGTDHISFQKAGLPGYDFMQDELDYFQRLHHTQLDVFDNVHEADLKQASVVMAAFLYNAAMREERMPRKPMPKN